MVHGRVGRSLLLLSESQRGHRMPLSQRGSMNHCSARVVIRREKLSILGSLPFNHTHGNCWM